MWEESQIGIIHFLLLISHNLVAIAKRFPLPYLLPNLCSVPVIDNAILTQLMVCINSR